MQLKERLLTSIIIKGIYRVQNYPRATSAYKKVQGHQATV